MSFASIFTGLAESAGGAALDIFAGGAGGLGNMLIMAGAGQVISGVGSMLAGGRPAQGFATATRNPIQPWNVCYGQTRPKGTLIYAHQWGLNNQMLDMVFALAAHPCASVDELLFDQQRVQIDATAIPTAAAAGYALPQAVEAGSGTSFTPVQQNISIAKLVRFNDVVTVTLPSDIPYLEAGDQFISQNISADLSMNGRFPVAEIISRVASGGSYILTFTFLCGGTATTIDNEGQVLTAWANYGRTVYMEVLTGAQTLGQTFVGMTAGTPWQGTGKLVTPASPGPAASGGSSAIEILSLGLLAGGWEAQPNPWTAYCSGVGKTMVFLRIYVDSTYYASGLPQISFHITGKNDIYDPRTSGYGYTNNAALCAADHLANKAWGFGCSYGDTSEIPTTALAAAADICDQSVARAAGGTEPRYTCNGQFLLSQGRGEVLDDLLTSCAGRRVEMGGQQFIVPGSWTGPGNSANLTSMAAGPFTWRPTQTIRELYNGCKGTYISPANKWQATDFPPYAQDTYHGYTAGAAWNAGIAYVAGALASYGDVSYSCLVNNTGNEPDTSPTYWGVTYADINLITDGGDRRWFELHLKFTTSPGQAQRTAKIAMLRSRFGGTGTFPLNMDGYRFAPLDVIQATVPALAWSGQALEVQAVRLRLGTGGKSAPLLSTEIDVQAVDSSIYDWAITEELTPQGYIQTSWPAAQITETIARPWSPGYVSPLSGDAIGGPASFGIEPGYDVDASGNPVATLRIKGTPPINALDTAVAKPQITASVVLSGGSLPDGTYVIGLSACDSGASNHGNSDYQNLVTVWISGGGGAASIDVTAVFGAGDDGGDIYMARPFTLGLRGNASAGGCYVFHYQATIAPGSTSATITAFDQSTPGGPDSLFDHLSASWMKEIHAGVWADQIVSVTATTVTVGGDGMTANQWAGYTLSLLAKYSSAAEIPILNIPVASSSASSGGTFTLTLGAGADGNTLADLTTLLDPLDLVVMRGRYTFTAAAFSDPNVANPYYPTGATGVEAGHVAVVLTGNDAGDIQPIASVSADGSGNYTIFNLAGNWLVTPATGDLVVICSPSRVSSDGTPMLIRNGSVAGVMLQPAVENLTLQAWLFLVRSESAAGTGSPDSLAPVRELYFFGAPSSLSQATITTTPYTAAATDTVLTLGTGSSVVNLPDGASARRQPLWIINASGSVITVQPAGADTTEGNTSLTIPAGLRYQLMPDS